MVERFDDEPSGISRRTVMKGVAWAIPTVALASAAPAFAASGVPDLGLDGWVRLQESGHSDNFTIDMSPTKDCPPYGGWTLWIKDSQSNYTATGATLTFVFSKKIGNVAVGSSPFTKSGPDKNSWSDLVYKGQVTGGYEYQATYTGDTWAFGNFNMPHCGNAQPSGLYATATNVTFTANNNPGCITSALTRTVTVTPGAGHPAQTIAFTRTINLGCN